MSFVVELIASFEMRCLKAQGGKKTQPLSNRVAGKGFDGRAEENKAAVCGFHHYV